MLLREGDRRWVRGIQLRAPRHHDSDHRAVIARVRGGATSKLHQYRKRRRKLPLRLGPGPRTELETAFEDLKATCEPPPPRKREANAWISDATWGLIDQRAALRKRGILSQANGRRLGRRIRVALKADRKKRAADTAAAIKGHLTAGNLKEAWCCVQRWYRQAEEIASRPSFLTMRRQTEDRIELYAWREPVGNPIPVNVEPFDIRDDKPDEGEIRAAVTGLNNGRAGGASQIRAKIIKEWLQGAKAEEAAERDRATPGGNAREQAKRWRDFVRLVQVIWDRGETPQQMLWNIVVLIPKGCGDYRGIGLMEPFWKVIEAVMTARLKAVTFHEVLHGCISERGTDTATIEAKLQQQLAYLEQEAFFGVFLDLKTAFDAMDRSRVLELLQGYGVGTKMLTLIRTFWESAEMVCKAKGNYGDPFRAGRGVTQGGPLSPTLFNLLVDAVTREWLVQVLGDEANTEWGRQTRRALCAFFYVDDAFLASRNPVFLQGALDVLVNLFDRVGLRTNTKKTKAMTFVPGKIRTRLSVASYTRSKSGTTTNKDWARRRVNCDKCGSTLR